MELVKALTLWVLTPLGWIVQNEEDNYLAYALFVVMWVVCLPGLIVRALYLGVKYVVEVVTSYVSRWFNVRRPTGKSTRVA